MEAVGDGVTSVSPGDRVVLVVGGAVRHAAGSAARRAPPVRARAAPAAAGPPRERRSAHRVSCDCGTLATHTVVTEPQVVPMPDALPLSRACLLGCGVSTGVGAAIQTAEGVAGGHRRRDRPRRHRSGGAAGREDRRRDEADRGRRRAGEAGVGCRGSARPTLVDASAGDAVEAVRGSPTARVSTSRSRRSAGPSACAQAVEMLGFAGTAVAIGVPPVPSEVTLRWNGSERAAYPQRRTCYHRRRRPHPRARTSPRWRHGRSTARSTSTRW